MGEYVVVKTIPGDVRGRSQISARNEQIYWSFQGIPYAKPPIGDLRFKNPQPVEPWSGIKDALAEPPSGPAIDFLTKKYAAGTSEDCLYLNVYTPKITDDKLAVMFWVHGGSFMWGSGNPDFYGPDYLVTEDVVLVTVNYRLGALGFLSLGTKECSGNYGLKDLTLALTWVRDNIASFGGDPNRVTIFGESAGSALVDNLMLSPTTKGLFHGAIAQSGATLNPWAYNNNPRLYATQLAKRMGYVGNSDQELLEYLGTASVEQIVLNSDRLYRDIQPCEKSFSVSFTPVTEPEGTEGAFLTKTREEVIEKGLIHDVPYICGVTTSEGTVIYEEDVSVKNDGDFEKRLPGDLGLEPGSELFKQVLAKIKQRYFKKPFYRQDLVEVSSYIYIILGVMKTLEGAVRNKTRTAPCYLYQFTFESVRNLVRMLDPIPGILGNYHGDELAYIFKPSVLPIDFQVGTREHRVMEMMTRLWTNFAKTHKPNITQEQKWLPYTITDKDYLEIGDQLQYKKNMNAEELKFWKDLYQFIGDSKH